ncbi:MAG: hypothetical protein WC530_04085 [Candidatus Omnitrophota bacterium]
MTEGRISDVGSINGPKGTLEEGTAGFDRVMGLLSNYGVFNGIAFSDGLGNGWMFGTTELSKIGTGVSVGFGNFKDQYGIQGVKGIENGVYEVNYLKREALTNDQLKAAIATRPELKGMTEGRISDVGSINGPKGTLEEGSAEYKTVMSTLSVVGVFDGIMFSDGAGRGWVTATADLNNISSAIFYGTGLNQGSVLYPLGSDTTRQDDGRFNRYYSGDKLIYSFDRETGVEYIRELAPQSVESQSLAFDIINEKTGTLGSGRARSVEFEVENGRTFIKILVSESRELMKMKEQGLTPTKDELKGGQYFVRVPVNVNPDYDDPRTKEVEHLKVISIGGVLCQFSETTVGGKTLWQFQGLADYSQNAQGRFAGGDVLDDHGVVRNLSSLLNGCSFSIGYGDAATAIVPMRDAQGNTTGWLRVANGNNMEDLEPLADPKKMQQAFRHNFSSSGPGDGVGTTAMKLSDMSRSFRSALGDRFISYTINAAYFHRESVFSLGQAGIQPGSVSHFDPLALSTYFGLDSTFSTPMEPDSVSHFGQMTKEWLSGSEGRFVAYEVDGFGNISVYGAELNKQTNMPEAKLSLISASMGSSAYSFTRFNPDPLNNFVIDQGRTDANSPLSVNALMSSSAFATRLFGALAVDTVKYSAPADPANPYVTQRVTYNWRDEMTQNATVHFAILPNGGRGAVDGIYRVENYDVTGWSAFRSSIGFGERKVVWTSTFDTQNDIYMFQSGSRSFEGIKFELDPNSGMLMGWGIDKAGNQHSYLTQNGTYIEHALNGIHHDTIYTGTNKALSTFNNWGNAYTRLEYQKRVGDISGIANFWFEVQTLARAATGIGRVSQYSVLSHEIVKGSGITWADAAFAIGIVAQVVVTVASLGATTPLMLGGRIALGTGKWLVATGQSLMNLSFKALETATFCMGFAVQTGYVVINAVAKLAAVAVGITAYTLSASLVVATYVVDIAGRVFASIGVTMLRGVGVVEWYSGLALNRTGQMFTGRIGGFLRETAGKLMLRSVRISSAAMGAMPANTLRGSLAFIWSEKFTMLATSGVRGTFAGMGKQILAETARLFGFEVRAAMIEGTAGANATYKLVYKGWSFTTLGRAWFGENYVTHGQFVQTLKNFFSIFRPTWYQPIMNAGKTVGGGVLGQMARMLWLNVYLWAGGTVASFGALGARMLGATGGEGGWASVRFLEYLGNFGQIINPETGLVDPRIIATSFLRQLGFEYSYDEKTRKTTFGWSSWGLVNLVVFSTAMQAFSPLMMALGTTRYGRAIGKVDDIISSRVSSKLGQDFLNGIWEEVVVEPGITLIATPVVAQMIGFVLTVGPWAAGAQNLAEARFGKGTPGAQAASGVLTLLAMDLANRFVQYIVEFATPGGANIKMTGTTQFSRASEVNGKSILQNTQQIGMKMSDVVAISGKNQQQTIDFMSQHGVSAQTQNDLNISVGEWCEKNKVSFAAVNQSFGVSQFQMGVIAQQMHLDLSTVATTLQMEVGQSYQMAFDSMASHAMDLGMSYSDYAQGSGASAVQMSSLENNFDITDEQLHTAVQKRAGAEVKAPTPGTYNTIADYVKALKDANPHLSVEQIYEVILSKMTIAQFADSQKKDAAQYLLGWNSILITPEQYPQLALPLGGNLYQAWQLTGTSSTAFLGKVGFNSVGFRNYLTYRAKALGFIRSGQTLSDIRDKGKFSEIIKSDLKEAKFTDEIDVLNEQRTLGEIFQGVKAIDRVKLLSVIGFDLTGLRETLQTNEKGIQTFMGFTVRSMVFNNDQMMANVLKGIGWSYREYAARLGIFTVGDFYREMTTNKDGLRILNGTEFADEMSIWDAINAVAADQSLNMSNEEVFFRFFGQMSMLEVQEAMFGITPTAAMRMSEFFHVNIRAREASDRSDVQHLEKDGTLSGKKMDPQSLPSAFVVHYQGSLPSEINLTGQPNGIVAVRDGDQVQIGKLLYKIRVADGLISFVCAEKLTQESIPQGIDKLAHRAAEHFLEKAAYLARGDYLPAIQQLQHSAEKYRDIFHGYEKQCRNSKDVNVKAQTEQWAKVAAGFDTIAKEFATLPTGQNIQAGQYATLLSQTIQQGLAAAILESQQAVNKAGRLTGSQLAGLIPSQFQTVTDLVQCITRILESGNLADAAPLITEVVSRYVSQSAVKPLTVKQETRHEAGKLKSVVQLVQFTKERYDRDRGRVVRVTEVRADEAAYTPDSAERELAQLFNDALEQYEILTGNDVYTRKGVTQGVAIANLLFRPDMFHKIPTGVGKTTTLFTAAALFHKQIRERLNVLRSAAPQRAKKMEGFYKNADGRLVFVLSDTNLLAQTLGEMKLLGEAGIAYKAFTEDDLQKIRMGDNELFEEYRKAELVLASGTAADFLQLDSERAMAIAAKDIGEQKQIENVKKFHELMTKENRYLFDEVDVSFTQPGTQVGEENRRLGDKGQSYEITSIQAVDAVIQEVLSQKFFEGKKPGDPAVDMRQWLEHERSMMRLTVFVDNDVKVMTYQEYAASNCRGSLIEARLDQTNPVAREVMEKLAKKAGVEVDVFSASVRDFEKQEISQKDNVRMLRASLVGRLKAIRQRDGIEVGRYLEMIPQTGSKQAERVMERFTFKEELKEAARQLLIAFGNDRKVLEAMARGEIPATVYDNEKLLGYLKNLRAEGLQDTLPLMQLQVAIKVISNNTIAPRLQQSDPFLSAHTQLVFLRLLDVKGGETVLTDNAPRPSLTSEKSVGAYLKTVTISGQAIHSTRERTIQAIKSGKSTLGGFTGTLEHVAQSAKDAYGVDVLIYVEGNPYFTRLENSTQDEDVVKTLSKIDQRNALILLRAVANDWGDVDYNKLAQLVRGDAAVIDRLPLDAKNAYGALKGKLAILEKLDLVKISRPVRQQDIHHHKGVDEAVKGVEAAITKQGSGHTVVANAMLTVDEDSVVKQLEAMTERLQKPGTVFRFLIAGRDTGEWTRVTYNSETKKLNKGERVGLKEVAEAMHRANDANAKNPVNQERLIIYFNTATTRGIDTFFAANMGLYVLADPASKLHEMEQLWGRHRGVREYKINDKGERILANVHATTVELARAFYEGQIAYEELMACLNDSARTKVQTLDGKTLDGSFTFETERTIEVTNEQGEDEKEQEANFELFHPAQLHFSGQAITVSEFEQLLTDNRELEAKRNNYNSARNTIEGSLQAFLAGLIRQEQGANAKEVLRDYFNRLHEFLDPDIELSLQQAISGIDGLRQTAARSLEFIKGITASVNASKLSTATRQRLEAEIKAIETVGGLNLIDHHVSVFQQLENGDWRRHEVVVDITDEDGQPKEGHLVGHEDVAVTFLTGRSEAEFQFEGKDVEAQRMGTVMARTPSEAMILLNQQLRSTALPTVAPYGGSKDARFERPITVQTAVDKYLRQQSQEAKDKFIIWANEQGWVDQQTGLLTQDGMNAAKALAKFRGDVIKGKQETLNVLTRLMTGRIRRSVNIPPDDKDPEFDIEVVNLFEGLINSLIIPMTRVDTNLMDNLTVFVRTLGYFEGAMKKSLTLEDIRTIFAKDNWRLELADWLSKNITDTTVKNQFNAVMGQKLDEYQRGRVRQYRSQEENRELKKFRTTIAGYTMSENWFKKSWFVGKFMVLRYSLTEGVTMLRQIGNEIVSSWRTLLSGKVKLDALSTLAKALTEAEVTEAEVALGMDLGLIQVPNDVKMSNKHAYTELDWRRALVNSWSKMDNMNVNGRKITLDRAVLQFAKKYIMEQHDSKETMGDSEDRLGIKGLEEASLLRELMARLQIERNNVRDRLAALGTFTKNLLLGVGLSLIKTWVGLGVLTTVVIGTSIVFGMPIIASIGVVAASGAGITLSLTALLMFKKSFRESVVGWLDRLMGRTGDFGDYFRNLESELMAKFTPVMWRSARWLKSEAGKGDRIVRILRAQALAVKDNAAEYRAAKGRLAEMLKARQDLLDVQAARYLEKDRDILVKIEGAFGRPDSKDETYSLRHGSLLRAGGQLIRVGRVNKKEVEVLVKDDGLTIYRESETTGRVVATNDPSHVAIGAEVFFNTASQTIEIQGVTDIIKQKESDFKKQKVFISAYVQRGGLMKEPKTITVYENVVASATDRSLIGKIITVDEKYDRQLLRQQLFERIMARVPGFEGKEYDALRDFLPATLRDIDPALMALYFKEYGVSMVSRGKTGELEMPTPEELDQVAQIAAKNIGRVLGHGEDASKWTREQTREIEKLLKTTLTSQDMSRLLGYDNDSAKWTEDQRKKIEEVLDDGLNEKKIAASKNYGKDPSKWTQEQQQEIRDVLAQKESNIREKWRQGLNVFLGILESEYRLLQEAKSEIIESWQDCMANGVCRGQFSDQFIDYMMQNMEVLKTLPIGIDPKADTNAYVRDGRMFVAGWMLEALTAIKRNPNLTDKEKAARYYLQANMIHELMEHQIDEAKKTPALWKTDEAKKIAGYFYPEEKSANGVWQMFRDFVAEYTASTFMMKVIPGANTNIENIENERQNLFDSYRAVGDVLGGEIYEKKANFYRAMANQKQDPWKLAEMGDFSGFDPIIKYFGSAGLPFEYAFRIREAMAQGDFTLAEAILEETYHKSTDNGEKSVDTPLYENWKKMIAEAKNDPIKGRQQGDDWTQELAQDLLTALDLLKSRPIVEKAYGGAAMRSELRTVESVVAERDTQERGSDRMVVLAGGMSPTGVVAPLMPVSGTVPVTVAGGTILKAVATAPAGVVAPVSAVGGTILEAVATAPAGVVAPVSAAGGTALVTAEAIASARTVTPVMTATGTAPVGTIAPVVTATGIAPAKTIASVVATVGATPVALVVTATETAPIAAVGESAPVESASVITSAGTTPVETPPALRPAETTAGVVATGVTPVRTAVPVLATAGTTPVRTASEVLTIGTAAPVETAPVIAAAGTMPVDTAPVAATSRTPVPVETAPLMTVAGTTSVETAPVIAGARTTSEEKAITAEVAVAKTAPAMAATGTTPVGTVPELTAPAPTPVEPVSVGTVPGPTPVEPALVVTTPGPTPVGTAPILAAKGLNAEAGLPERLTLFDRFKGLFSPKARFDNDVRDYKASKGNQAAVVRWMQLYEKDPDSFMTELRRRLDYNLYGTDDILNILVMLSAIPKEDVKKSLTASVALELFKLISLCARNDEFRLKLYMPVEQLLKLALAGEKAAQGVVGQAVTRSGGPLPAGYELRLASSIPGAADYDPRLVGKAGYENEGTKEIVLNRDHLDAKLAELQKMDLLEQEVAYRQLVDDLAVVLVHEKVHIAGGDELVAYDATVAAMIKFDEARYADLIALINALLAIARGNVNVEPGLRQDMLQIATMTLNATVNANTGIETLLNRIMAHTYAVRDPQFRAMGFGDVRDIKTVADAMNLIERLKSKVASGEHTAVFVNEQLLTADLEMRKAVDRLKDLGCAVFIRRGEDVGKSYYVGKLAAALGTKLFEKFFGQVREPKSSNFAGYFTIEACFANQLIARLIIEIIAQKQAASSA